MLLNGFGALIDQGEISRKSGASRILVVDQNPAQLRSAVQVLRSAGYEVLEATTGSAGLEAAPLADLVVLDFDLPDMDGFEVCRRMRALPRTAEMPVLHLAATFARVRGYTHGFDARYESYLTRPVEAPVLIATVRTLLFAAHAESVGRRAHARLRAMLELVPLAIAVLDDGLTMESVNPAYSALTGYAPKELVGQKLALCLSDTPENERGLALMQSAIHERYSGHLTVRHKDGSIAEIQAQVAREGEAGARILVASEHIPAAGERIPVASERTARATAERSNRLEEEFLATLSHELRNPLNAILGWATLLNRKSGLPEMVAQGLGAIERNSRIQARMISDLQDYAGITFGEVRLVIETLDPYPILKATVESVRDAAQAAGVELRAFCAEDLVRIDADPARLQQIVWNLLTNAIKFSPRGAAVDVMATRHGDEFRLVVRDYGQGIEPEFLPRIFERFSQRGATTTRSHGGLGLGMAIVKQLTDAHGGSIRAESGGNGQGATFTLDIPVSRNESEPSPSGSRILRAVD